jgi:hypothetical protein
VRGVPYTSQQWIDEFTESHSDDHLDKMDFMASPRLWGMADHKPASVEAQNGLVNHSANSMAVPVSVTISFMGIPGNIDNGKDKADNANEI